MNAAPPVTPFVQEHADNLLNACNGACKQMALNIGSINHATTAAITGALNIGQEPLTNMTAGIAS